MLISRRLRKTSDVFALRELVHMIEAHAVVPSASGNWSIGHVGKSPLVST